MMNIRDAGISQWELLFYCYLIFSSKLILIIGSLFGTIWEKKKAGHSITELIEKLDKMNILRNLAYHFSFKGITTLFSKCWKVFFTLKG